MKSVFRAWRIGRVLLRYRLDDLLDDTPVEPWLKLARPFVPRASAEIAALSRGARLRLALQELGPIFVKFGQILSTRRDLVPPDVAEELSLLQDRVAPFDGEAARADRRARAGAAGQRSLRAVRHLPAGLGLDRAGACGDAAADANGVRARSWSRCCGRTSRSRSAATSPCSRPSPASSTAPIPAPTRSARATIVDEIENTLAAELDLQREGANASVLRRFWADSDDLYVPEVIWSHTAERALTLERVRGIPSDDIAALDAAGIDRHALAAKGVRVFYTQVFRDNFFHADAHAGNIWVDSDPARRTNPRFIALDFGIMGQLSDEDQYYLAENFMAIFNRDYRRIAELHVRGRLDAVAHPHRRTRSGRALGVRAVLHPPADARSRWPRCCSSCSAPRSATS